MSRSINIRCTAFKTLQNVPELTFVRLVGHESVSELFNYTIDLKTPDPRNPVTGSGANALLSGFVGQECGVSIELEGKGPEGEGAGKREINGLITDAAIVRTEGRHVVYRLTLRPWLWLADRTSDFKIFQGLNVADMVSEVLGEYGFPVEKRLAGSFPVRDYQVQYGETDFQFVQRVLQEWGIYWFFEHTEGKHTLVLCDHMGAHTPFSSPAYHKLSLLAHDHKADEEYFTSFDLVESLTTGAWASNDFDFTKPTSDLMVKNAHPRETKHATLERYEWPGDYAHPGEGDTLARVRMEEARVAGRRAHASGNVRAVVPGCTFTLLNHPHDAANAEYLVLGTRLELEDVGEESGSQIYRQQVEVEAYPTDQPYRPTRTQPKPRTRGPQTATITGPDGQEIWTDKFGRVKVQFHWDRYGKKDENASCWVRVSQPWAGSNFGAIYLPRIGQEVVVDFLNGDPDLPLITGRVYNAVNMPPWPLPDNATQSGVLTRSSREGDAANANAIRFEDKKDKEELWTHAEKDQRGEIENDETRWVGHDRTTTVVNDESEDVGHNRDRTVGNNETIGIAINRMKTVGVSETDAIGLDWNIAVGLLKAESVGGMCTQAVGLSKTTFVAQNFETTVGENHTLSVGKDHTVTVEKNESISVAEDQTVDVGKNISISAEEDLVVTAKNETRTLEKELCLDAGESISITCGESSITMKKDGTITLKGKDITVESSGEQYYKADKNITFKGQKILEN